MFLMEVLFNFPLFTTALMLLAGVLVGCAIAFSMRPDSRKLVEELAVLRSQNEAIQKSLASEVAVRQKANQQYSQQSAELSQLRMEHAKITQAWGGLLTNRVKLKDEISALKRAIDVAYELSRRERTKFASADDKLQEAENVIEKLCTRLEKAGTKLIRQQKLTVDLNKKVTTLESLKVGFGRAVQLAKTQRKQLENPHENRQPTSSNGPTNAVRQEDVDQPKNIRHDPKLGLVYTAAPQNPDDLKLIAGIASAFEKRLNDFGVYTYHQIMNWDRTAIDEISRLLICRDRVRREHWVSQAQQLHEKNHSKPANAA